MNDLIVLAVRNLTKLNGKPFTLLKRLYSCEIHYSPESGFLRVYGLISGQWFYIAKYTKAVQKRLYRSVNLQRILTEQFQCEQQNPRKHNAPCKQ